MNDDELKSMLREWQAPPAPPSLRGRVFKQRRSWLRWLLSGEIRVPVPFALAAILLIALVMYRQLRPSAASLSDFQHVQQLEPRIVRSVYEKP